MMGIRAFLVGYCCALILFEEAFASAEFSEECEDFADDHIDESCVQLQTMKLQGNYPYNCINEIINSKFYDNYKKRYAFEHLAYQYCFEHIETNFCNNCFQNAFSDHSGKDFCLAANGYRLSEVQNCLRTYRNPVFDWSRNIIMNNREETLDFSAFEFKRCKDVFTLELLPTDKRVNFPVRMYKQTEAAQRYITTFLSFFMDGLRHNDILNRDFVNCEDVLNSDILGTYKKMSTELIRVVPAVVTESYSKLRNSMCSKSTDILHCENCFRNADAEFLFHIYNIESVNFVRKDFKKISDEYTNCIENHIGENYYFVEESLNDFKNAWPLISDDCVDSISNKSQQIMKQQNQTVKVAKEIKHIVKSVFGNYLGYYQHQSLAESGPNKKCEYVQRSNILCLAEQTTQSLLRLKDETFSKKLSKDQKVEHILSNIQLCGKM